ncbi:POP1-domain-containing protein [Rhodocollybia butyracea]|uniref:POP1-domain-containing protein n=1 Tax=Rhodocollybia butyracea TaxID=206335 RepID=A0A9P5QA81_9AGAR|nr:POP1-domain-containing protein [Rhodocollybia butyracea]
MKRTLDDAQSTNFKERKKQKLADARTIAVQSNAVAGPSRSGPTVNDKMKLLPGAIDVEKFAEVRSFEINAMRNAMKTASSASTTRAWQVLPRHLRRRAASHNPRRVPIRLRDKARAEMDPMRRKALGRSMPKLGKARRLPKSVLFLKRQRDKRWLETHLWHAKRMKMENMWGYRLAVTPTEKAFRPSHRASIHGSILHDASYMSLIELKGPESTLKSILDICCDAQEVGPGTKRFASGARLCKTHIYEPNAYPLDLICPIAVMWKARPLAASKHMDSTSKSKKKGKGKGKDARSEPSSGPVHSTAWIRFHPSVFDEVFTALRLATSQVLDSLNKKGIMVDVELADIRGEVGIFEIMGPKSNQVLRGALSPVMTGASDDFKRFWESLGNVQSSDSVPGNMIIGFTVNDPRLRFPPKNAKVRLPTGSNVSPPMGVFPSADLAACTLWEQSIRNHLKKPRYQTKDVNERRSKNPVLGTPLQPLRQDDRVPVILIQTSVQPVGPNDTENIHGWTLIFPAGWSMAFFQQLTYTGTRIAGQRERKVQGFEAGAAYFPSDYPSTSAYRAYAATRAEAEKAKWTRTPPAKKTNYGKLGTRSPWLPDWEVILGLNEAQSQPEEEEENDTTVHLVTTQRELEQPQPLTSVPTAAANQSIRPWLFHGPEVPGILHDLSKVFNQEQQLLTIFNRLRAKRFLEPLNDAAQPKHLLKSALVTVKVSICCKGAPGDLALIYSIPDMELQEWRKGLSKARAESLPEEDHFVNLPDIVPPPNSIIGYITTGGFSLSRGEGFAIGAIALTRLLELEQQARRISFFAKADGVLFVKVRDRKGHKCRLARIQVLQN